MLVDDDEDFRDVAAMMLQRTGHEVRTAANAREALHSLARPPLPCLIVTDLDMPVVSGLELIEQLRVHPAAREIPVIVCSAAPLAVLGVDACFSKMDFDDVVAYIVRACEGKAREQSAR